VLFSNTRFQEYLGITDEDKVNAFSADCVYPDDHSASLAVFTKTVKTKTAFEIQRRLKGADNEFRWFMTRGTPILDFDDNVVDLYGT
jgi:PAS domain-containing protein